VGEDGRGIAALGDWLRAEAPWTWALIGPSDMKGKRVRAEDRNRESPTGCWRGYGSEQWQMARFYEHPITAATQRHSPSMQQVKRHGGGIVIRSGRRKATET